MKTNRQIALEWWNNLSFIDQALIAEGYSIYTGIERTPESLTGREIESLCPKHLLTT